MSAPGDTPAAAALVPARWFDGRSSQARAVLVGLHPAPGGPSLSVHPVGAPGGEALHLSWREVGWPEAWSARRPQQRVVVDLHAHGSLEIDAVAAWHSALAAAGDRPRLAQRMQTRWGIFLAMLLAGMLGLALFYRYGTPWLATQLARWVPLGWETALANHGLAQMDDGMLKPSALPRARQEALRARFQGLTQTLAMAPALQRYPGYAPQWSLAFRRGMGANAFALPGGTVVLTDEIVQVAERQGLGDEALAGVLAHEIGHVAYRHTTRMLVQQGVLQMGLELALGDVSGLLSSGSALLTAMSYSRAHEREADCFALGLMHRAALPTAPMGDLLLAMVQDARSGGKDPQPGKATEPGQDEAHPIWSLLSSHPDTAERARALRAGQAPGCS